MVGQCGEVRNTSARKGHMQEEPWNLPYEGGEHSEYEEYEDFGDDLPEWFETAFNDMILDGLIEIVAINPDGKWMYQVSAKGKEYIETYGSLRGDDKL